MPLEELARCVKAFGEGETFTVPSLQGTREILQLAVNFQAMQTQIKDSNQARLEIERLATIGRMATSVSHDLRHHLASIYANAEFLAAADSTDEERVEFFADIHAAVIGTTEMLESLTIFSRTGRVARHAPERINVLLENAVIQLRMHPAAANISLQILDKSSDASICADGKQIERALFNLLLNACQSVRPTGRPGLVTAILEGDCESVCVSIFDNGVGIPGAVQHNLFEPFISSGKQNGTGLGLTLARHIAEDHRGRVNLLRSSFEETVFQLCLPLSGEDDSSHSNFPPNSNA